MNIKFRKLLIIILLFFLAGCGGGHEKVKFSVTTSAALQKFEVLSKEAGYSPVFKLTGSTLWVYMPLEEPLMNIQAGESSAVASKSPGAAKMSLVYYDVKFNAGEFNIVYDDEMRRTYPSNINYKTSYRESYQQKQQSILNFILRAFYDAKEPEFIVLVFADIVNGMEAKTIFYFDDMRKASSMPPALSTDEYAKRFITEVNGEKGAIGDKEGRHLDWKPLSWPDFLTRQIKHRIAFKFQQSTFPPSQETRQELAQICLDAIKAYDFKDYKAIVLEDIATGELFNID
jgi:hypothetical protein